MKIDILVGNNLYDSTLSFAKSLHNAFQQIEIESRLFWIDDGYFYQAFYEIMADPPDLTCSFADIRLNNTPLAALWNIPHLSFLIDPAIYFLHHLKSPRSIVTCVDEEDVSFIRNFGFPHAFFLPHAADEKECTSPESQRPYEKVFFGSCIDIEEVLARWKSQYIAKNQDVFHEAARRVLSPEGISTLKALNELDVQEKDLPLFHYEVDLYTRGMDRIELLKRHDVHIWGRGPWTKYCPKAHVHEPISFDACLNIMKQSKIVFNSSPRFKHGSHERIFYALMCGACPVTLENSYVNKTFSKNELMTYQTGTWEINLSLPWQETAFRGQKKVIAEHTWLKRAQTIRSFLLSCL